MTIPSPVANNESHRRYIQRERLIGTGVNLVISVAFTVLLFSTFPVIEMWGANGIAVDLVATVFMLTLMGGLALGVLTTKRVRDGAIDPLPQRLWGKLVRTLPRNVLVRTAIVAVAVTTLVVPLSVLVFWLLGIESMSFSGYLVFKALYGPLVGALSATVIIETALMNCSLPGRP
jgi:hypothetical protein